LAFVGPIFPATSFFLHVVIGLRWPDISRDIFLPTCSNWPSLARYFPIPQVDCGPLCPTRHCLQFCGDFSALPDRELALRRVSSSIHHQGSCDQNSSSIPDPSWFRVDTIHRTQCPALPPVSSSIPDPSWFRVDTIHRTQCPALPPVSSNSNAVPRLLSPAYLALQWSCDDPIVDLLKPLFPGISCDSGPAILLDSTLSRLPKCSGPIRYWTCAVSSGPPDPIPSLRFPHSEVVVCGPWMSLVRCLSENPGPRMPRMPYWTCRTWLS
jgi:hypothetical protein